MDPAAFRAWAKLMHSRPNQLMEDAMIAVTAKVHELVVVTRNVRDFHTLGTKTLNPFQPAKIGKTPGRQDSFQVRARWRRP
jgi:toxin FitB